MKKTGFTLMELLITVSIIIVISTAVLSVINPVATYNKAEDAKAKKDLARIKVAFEEYFSDKGCYPDETIISSLECWKNGFAPWLPVWPCADDNMYKIVIEKNASNCPKWYKVMVNLENKKDPDIPINWYGENKNIDDGYTNNDVNYGVSSQNVLWSEIDL